MNGRDIVQLIGDDENEKLVDGLHTFRCGDVDPVVCANQLFQKDATTIVVASERTMGPSKRVINSYELNKMCTTHHFSCDGVLWWIMTYGEELPMAIQQRIIMICGNGVTLTRYDDTGSEELLELIQPLKSFSDAPVLHGMRTCGTRVITVCSDFNGRIFNLLRPGDKIARPVLIADSSTVNAYALHDFDKMLKRYYDNVELARTTIETDRTWVLMQVMDDDDEQQDISEGLVVQVQEDIVKSMDESFN